VAFYAAKKEMVADTIDRCARIDNVADRPGRYDGAGSFYLHSFLTMPDADNNKSKETVLVITVGFLVLYLVFSRRIFLTLSLVIGLAGILSSWLSGKIDLVWNKLSLLLGRVSNTVLLTLIFFLVLTPMGLLRRLMGKGGMLRVTAGQRSGFIDRNHCFTKKDMENVW
jgi:hypothetical protein